MGNTFAVLPGGKGGNQAVAAAHAGGDVTFIARVGKDDLGKEALANYQNSGIVTEHIRVDPDAPSGTAMILVNSETGENAIVVVPGANGNLSPADVEAAEAAIEQADVLLVQLETPLPAVARALELAKKHGVRTILNPAPARELPEEILKNVDCITPNETETEVLTGILPDDEASLQAAAERLHQHVQTVLITLGARGVYVSEKDHQSIVPTTKVQAVDTTAAGDVFNGYFAAGLAEGMDLFAAIERANRAAAISVTRHGAQPSIPFLREVS